MSWGAILAGAGQLVSGVTSAYGASQQLSARDAMDAQAQFNWAQHKKSLLEGPSLEMRGLKAAGINPLLRYGQHGTPMSHSAQGVGQPPSVNRLQGLADAIGDTSSSAMAVVEGLSRARNLDAQTVKAGQELSLIAAQTDKVGTEEQKVFVDIQTAYLDQALRRVQTDAARQQIQLLQTQLANVDADTQLKLWQAAVAEAEAELRRLNMPKAENLAQFYSSVWGYYATKIDEVGRALNPFSSATTPNWTIK